MSLRNTGRIVDLKKEEVVSASKHFRIVDFSLDCAPVLPVMLGAEAVLYEYTNLYVYVCEQQQTEPL